MAARPSPIYIGFTKGDLQVKDAVIGESGERLWLIQCNRCKGKPYTVKDSTMRYTDSLMCSPCAVRENIKKGRQVHRIDSLVKTRKLYFSLIVDCGYTVEAVARWARLPLNIVASAVQDEQKSRNLTSSK